MHHTPTTIALAAFALLIALSAPSLGGDRVYRYHGDDGVPLFTDKRLSGVRPVSVKYYGRPPAVAHCNSGSSRVRKRMQRYQPQIDRMAARYGIDSELIRAVILTESCFNPRAVSRVGARGLMQLMPATARMLGVDDVFDPEQNIEGGVRYLRMMLDEFDQDTTLALAAYNAGPQAVKKYGNAIPPYRETRNYVRKILGMI